MSPSSFDSIEGLFTKFKSLVINLKNCGIEKKGDQLILSILSKLGPEYLVFVSTFHATRLVASNQKIPSLCTFFDSLTKEKDKLIQMGALKYSKVKDHAIIFKESIIPNQKRSKL